MFQNVDLKNAESNENTIDNNYNKGKIENIISIIGQVFNRKNILLYILSFMLSMVSFGDGIQPFSIAIFAAACANSIPVIFIYLFTILGTAIKFGGSGVLNYLLISLLFIALILIFKPWYEEEYKSERRKLGKYVFFATLIIQTIELFFNEVLIYNILITIISALSSYIFYKIFAGSISVIYEWGDKEAFSIEEIIGATLIIAISLLSIGNLSIFGLNIGQVIMIVMVLILGWKNGVMVGATSGIVVGATIGIIGNTNPIIIASFALSGMIAGILNRFGKIGVIAGFMVGNAILTYIYNGDTVAIVYFKEILVASLILITIPKNIKINIEDLFDKTKALPDGTIYRLEDSKETALKLNEVSNLIHDISDNYISSDTDTRKETFLNELDNKLKNMEENILYEDINDYSNGIIDDAFEILTNKNKITNADLQEIFKKRNTYIVSLNNENDVEDIERQENEIADIINEAYKISNVNYIWKKKITDNKRVISNQLENVSEVISELAKDIDSNENNFTKEITEIRSLAQKKDIKILDIKIKQSEGKYIINLCTNICMKECYTDSISKIISNVLNTDIVLQSKECAIDKGNNLCKQVYTTKDNYLLRVGISKRTKDKSIASGDSYIKTKLDDGKILVALSDGMGSGSEARKTSKIAIKMLERLLKSGFEKDSSIKLINNTMCLNSKDDMYATMDISVVDLFNGSIEIIKNGACPTFIKNKNEVQLVKSYSLPTGILDNVELVSFEKKFEDGDILVMCTDGVIDSNKEENKEEWIKNLLTEIRTDDVNRIAEIIMQESVDNYVGKPKDDMTVIVLKLLKR